MIYETSKGDYIAAMDGSNEDGFAVYVYNQREVAGADGTRMYWFETTGEGDWTWERLTQEQVAEQARRWDNTRAAEQMRVFLDAVCGENVKA